MRISFGLFCFWEGSKTIINLKIKLKDIEVQAWTLKLLHVVQGNPCKTLTWFCPPLTRPSSSQPLGMSARVTRARMLGCARVFFLVLIWLLRR